MTKHKGLKSTQFLFEMGLSVSGFMIKDLNVFSERLVMCASKHACSHLQIWGEQAGGHVAAARGQRLEMRADFWGPFKNRKGRQQNNNGTVLVQSLPVGLECSECQRASLVSFKHIGIFLSCHIRTTEVQVPTQTRHRLYWR